MTEVQSVTGQLATYEAKINEAEYRRALALGEIDHCRKERTRLGVLLEFGESTRADLDALRGRERRASQSGMKPRPSSSCPGGGAHRRPARYPHRLDTARDLLSLLERVGERYTELRALSLKVGDRRLEGVSRAGNLATERWPEYLRADLPKIEAQLEGVPTPAGPGYRGGGDHAEPEPAQGETSA